MTSGSVPPLPAGRDAMWFTLAMAFGVNWWIEHHGKEINKDNANYWHNAAHAAKYSLEQHGHSVKFVPLGVEIDGKLVR